MLCDRCVGINFDASIIYPLTHARVVEESAETGCQGCNFFIELCHRHRMDLGQMSLWTIVLRRLSEKSSRVNMIFVRDFQEGMHISAEQRGAPRLRLCSSVGKSAHRISYSPLRGLQVLRGFFPMISMLKVMLYQAGSSLPTPTMMNV